MFVHIDKQVDMQRVTYPTLPPTLLTSAFPITTDYMKGNVLRLYTCTSYIHDDEGGADDINRSNNNDVDDSDNNDNEKQKG